jgi:hypothetical protein
VIRQQGQHVGQVLGVDLDDLELGQEQVSRRDRQAGGGQVAIQIEGVAHPEGTDEGIDLTAVERVVMEESAVAVEGVETGVGLVAGRLEDTAERLAGRARDDVVEVAVGAAERQRDRAVGVEGDARPAEQPGGDVGITRDGREAARFIEDVGEGTAHAGVPLVSRWIVS